MGPLEGLKIIEVAGIGPDVSNATRMSRRQASLALTQSRMDVRHPWTPRVSHSAMSARYRARSSAGLIIPRRSTTSR